MTDETKLLRKVLVRPGDKEEKYEAHQEKGIRWHTEQSVYPDPVYGSSAGRRFHGDLAVPEPYACKDGI